MKRKADRPGGAAKPRAHAEGLARKMAARLPPSADTASPEGSGRTPNEPRMHRVDLGMQKSDSLAPLSLEESRWMLHELRAHQIELEMQNEELRQSQRALDAARERYVELYDLAPVGYCTVGETGLILEANLTAAKLLGAERGALVGQQINRFIFKEDQDGFYLQRERLGDSDKPLACELRMLKNGGAQFWADVMTTARREADGALVHHVVLIDISRRRKAEKALRESEEIFRYFMEFSPIYVFFKDENGRSLRLSRNFETMLGRPMRELLAKNMDELFASDPAKSMVADDVSVMRAGKSITQEAERNGRVFSTTKFPIIIEGKARYLAGFAIDITERKHAEDMLRAAHDQLRQLAIRLIGAHETESGLLSRELHDEFGQMLTSLKLDLGWLAAQLGEGNPAFKDRIDSSVALVNALVRTVRSIAARLRPRILDHLGLLPAIEWLVQDFRERTGIDAVFVAGAQASTLSPEQATAVFRIVQESLTNVARHAHAKSADVSLHAEDGSLVLEIRDNGVGLAEGRPASKEAVGLLGMRERALAAGGRLTVQGVPGRGTVVTLRLPPTEENS